MQNLKTGGKVGFFSNLMRLVAAARPRRSRAGSLSAIESFEARVLLSATRAVRKATQDTAAKTAVVDGLPASLPATQASPLAAPPFALNQTFLLNSRASATKTIYLDFNGHTTTGTTWNSQYSGGAPIVTPAYSLDGNVAFSNLELEQIQLIWQRVAEDFAPFDVNVTTQQPPLSDIVDSGTGDTRWGIRVAIGGDSSDWLGSPAGGVAFLNTFGSAVDTPTFVFPESLSLDTKNIAEATSHEVGHTLGLEHDGRTSPSEEYYRGHGFGATSWAPIMGVGYSRQVVQWSKGEYANSSNKQDDLSIITTRNGFGYRPDDYGSTRATATGLAYTGGSGVKVINVAGVIEKNTDQDWFGFATTGGLINLTFTPAPQGPNLDIQAQLFNEQGVLIATSNPANSLGASLNTTVAAGTYYIVIDGVGFQTATTGYTDYGSLGQYTITGTVADSGNGNSPSSVSGRVWHDIDGDGVFDTGEKALANVRVYVDLNGNGKFESALETGVLTNANGQYTLTNLAPGQHNIAQVVPAGFQQIVPTTSSYQVNLFGGQVLSNLNFRNVRPPVVGNFAGNVTYRARSIPVRIAPSATVADLDTTVFNGGTLNVSLVTNGDGADRVAIRNEGTGSSQINVLTNTIRFGTTVIGTFTGGVGTTPLAVTFNANATAVAVQALIRNITFSSASITPPTATRTVRFQLTDPTGGTTGPLTKQIFVTSATGVAVPTTATTTVRASRRG